MIEPVVKTVDGVEYKIYPFPGMQGWKMQLKLGRMVGPALQDLLAALPIKEKGGLGEIDAGKAGAAIGRLMEAIADGDPNGAFVEQLLSKTERDGVLLIKHQIDQTFAANYFEMGKAIFAVIQANNFFGIGNSGLLNGLQNLTANSTAS